MTFVSDPDYPDPKQWPDGLATPMIHYSMEVSGIGAHMMHVNRYGESYYFRDIGVPLSKTRCSFNVKAKDLRAMLDWADAHPSGLGDVLFLELRQDDTGKSIQKPPSGTKTLFDFWEEENDTDNE